MVRVVVRERTDGAGDENVLSPPLRPWAVRLVSASEDGPCEMALIERDLPCSVDRVGATERPPVVGGGCSSLESRTDSSRSRDSVLANLRLGPDESE